MSKVAHKNEWEETHFEDAREKSHDFGEFVAPDLDDIATKAPLMRTRKV
jgi:hypothetical protein